ncbi:hypothetical protein FA13DRAFT_1704036 [Coprinellus micaceus]|uniref:Uncharacterized protein n=1 Tax=Coprinellus micaceus TaxID=71717 RepID=A0A4Y7U0A1_COPMI|nr:hypothetical protein FA13DRAFT_1704036 [Coprinellus micaceus]
MSYLPSSILSFRSMDLWYTAINECDSGLNDQDIRIPAAWASEGEGKACTTCPTFASMYTCFPTTSGEMRLCTRCEHVEVKMTAMGSGFGAMRSHGSEGLGFMISVKGWQRWRAAL